jgi:hypothetical protein
MEGATAFTASDAARIVFDVEFTRDVVAPQFGFACSTKEGTLIYLTNTVMLGIAAVPALAGERRRVEVSFRLDVGVGDVFVDVSAFELEHGAVNVLDARLHVLHLTVSMSPDYTGMANMSAVIRQMP